MVTVADDRVSAELDSFSSDSKQVATPCRRRAGAREGC